MAAPSASTVYRSESYFEGWLNLFKSSHPSFSNQFKKYFLVIMRKTEEAVVRQDSEDGTKNPGERGVSQKVEVDLHQNMVDEVNNWISESRESRRAEKAFSDERISNWKTNPSDKLP